MKSPDPSAGEKKAPASREMGRVFAAVEELGVRIGVVLAVAGFVLYATGWLSPLLPIDELIRSWGLPADDFLRRTGLPGGWGWAGLLGHSDMLALAGLVLLSSVAGAAYLGLLPRLLRARDRTYALLVVLQLGVFLLAASGWLTGGH
jgi:hypothetical protein